MRRLVFTLIVLGVVAALPAHAQASIDPGMSRAEVIERLGKPVGESSTGQYRYLFYQNGCEVKCGMQDLVILQDDMVVDAIFRSSKRTFTGMSSSPNGITPEAGGNRRATEGSGNIKITPSAEGASDRSGGGIVTGTAPAPAVPKPTTPAQQPAAGTGTTIITPPAGSTTIITTPAATGAANPMTAGPSTGGAHPASTVPPLSPRDTTNVQPNRSTQGQLTPATKDAAPVPFTGSKPNPRDSAEKARTGQKPDSTKPPED